MSIDALNVRNLRLEIEAAHGPVTILDDVSFQLEPGGRLGIVGESGSGKSMTAFSILRLLPAQSHLAGNITLGDQEITSLDEPAMATIRGKRIAMIFQEPATALNPVKTIGAQVAEAASLQLGLSQNEALAKAAHWLKRTGLDPKDFPLHLYPHQLSGGQRQRVLIAAALAGEPDILIADEPTTALDATIQLQILRLIDGLVKERGLSLIIISHDLGVIAAMADDIVVMNKGRVVEQGDAATLFDAPQDPYTQMLLEACPSLDDASLASAPQHVAGEPLLKLGAVTCRYKKPKSTLFAKTRWTIAVDSQSLHIQPRESLGIVGESGSGKSTMAKAIAGLIKPAGGAIHFKGERIDGLTPAKRLAARLPISMIFQDPNGSLNPRHTILQSITEPLHRQSLSRQQRMEAATRALETVKLDPSTLHRYPHEFSGGQRQRIATARALIDAPELLIADEPVAALDVSIQAQIIDLLNELRATLNLTLIFISHDLAVVRHTTDRTLVMHQGKIVEQGATGEIFQNPTHLYTQQLLEAVLPADPSQARSRLKG